MSSRRIISRIVGMVQSAVGAITIIFAYALHSNLFGMQSTLGISAKSLPLYVLILVIFGFLSIISGLFLICD